MFFAGWDGGGTKTAVCIADARGNVLSRAVFGPINANSGSEANVRRTIREGIAFMAGQPGGLEACGGLVIGAAGVSSASTSQLIRSAVRACGYVGPLALVGDHEIALAGAIEGCGAVLSAGTGSICFGRGKDGTTFRAGGFGYLIDDEGSGWAIGRDILRAVARASDGRGAHTCLEALVRQRLGVDDLSGVVTWLYSPQTGRSDVAMLAELLPEALRAGDAVAGAIADRAAEELYRLVDAVWRGCGLTGGELALTGSVLRRGPDVRLRLVELIRARRPDVTVRDPARPPEEGAALDAIERFPLKPGRQA